MSEYDETGLTDAEREIMSDLVSAWSGFLFLDNVREDERNEFMEAIHQAQNVLAHRALGRLSPDYWRGGGTKNE